MMTARILGLMIIIMIDDCLVLWYTYCKSDKRKDKTL